MHPASAFYVSDPERLAELTAQRGFAVIIGAVRGRPVVAHSPVLLADGVLRFHLSRANPLALALTDGKRALAVINGPDAYISPDWYGEPDKVPTWNYLSVEIEGTVKTLDEAGSAALLDDLSAHFEKRLEPKRPWTRGKMSPGRFDALLRGIVCFSMTVDRLEGIEKLDQHKASAAQAAAAEWLSAVKEPGAREIAAMMKAQAAARKAGSRA